MERVIETAPENQPSGRTATVTKFVREIRVNYRGPKKEQVSIQLPKTAADFIRKVLPDNSREHFVCLYLDAAHAIAGFAVTATGTATYCLVHCREVFQRAIPASVDLGAVNGSHLYFRLHLHPHYPLGFLVAMGYPAN